MSFRVGITKGTEGEDRDQQNKTLYVNKGGLFNKRSHKIFSRDRHNSIILLTSLLTCFCLSKA